MDKEIQLTPFYFDHVLQSQHTVVLQIGGRYSAKTQNEQIRLIGNMASKEDYKLLVVEDLETSMSEGFHSGLRDRIAEFEHEAAYNSPSRVAYIENIINGNKALFKGYKTEQQRLNVKKLGNITEILVEEGEWMDYDAFIGLLMQLRGGHEGDRKLTILMNPVNPDCFVNEEFIIKPPTRVITYFKGTKRPKVFEHDIVVKMDDISVTITVLVVLSTHHDNPFLTPLQRASIEQLKEKDPDKYAQLGEAKFIRPKGSLLTQRNYYSIDKFDRTQAARSTAIVDTASSGTDSATLGIYDIVDEEHHYLIDAIKDDSEAKMVIPRMVRMIKKIRPQVVNVERNHEGLYYKSELQKGLKGTGIKVCDFWSSENKHEKILGQSGRMIEDLYIRDDASAEYNDFISEAYQYNKDTRINKKMGLHDDCIDNIAMYFKHGNPITWGWN